jgi:hypothetical protein
VTKIDEDTHYDLMSLEENVVDQYPEKTLTVLWAILPEDVTVWPYSMEETLQRIGNADPSLLKDHRLVELKRRWNAR